METFFLTTKVGKAGKVHLVLEMRQDYPATASSLLVKSWAVPYTAAAGGTEEKVRTVLKVAERRGVLANAAWGDAPRAFDGSAREFVNHLFERNNKVGELRLGDNSEGMRLALAFALAGRCNSVTRMGRVADGLTNLPAEVVLYWFTLCLYGQHQKAGKAALFTLLNTKG